MNILLSLQNITKLYGDFRALKGISLDIFKGEIIALLGVNGAGKTTLSSIIATLNPPTTGDILMNGTSIYADVSSYRRLIGFCPQKPNLNPHLTLRENLEFAGRFYGLTEPVVQQRVDEVMKRFNLEKYANKFANELSGGYKQRFVIARTLLHKPHMILFDEPTVALDPHVRHQLWELIKELRNDGVTIILTTHYIDEAEALSDRVVILDEGNIMLIDTSDNLKKQHQEGRLEDVFIKLMTKNEEE